VPFEVPEVWEWVLIKKICKSISAGGDKPDCFSQYQTDDISIPVIANGEMNKGIIGYTKQASVLEKSITVSGRGTIGFSCIRTEPYYPIVRLLVIIPYEQVCIEYIHYVLEAMREASAGSSIPQLTVPMLSLKMIPLPPLCEQNRIVIAIKTMFALIDDLEHNKIDIQSIITKTKAKVLSLAISGKLVPQDPNDEPASMLLDRIKAERDKQIKTGKIKPDKREKTHQITRDNSHYTDIPKSWVVCRLGDLVRIISGVSYNKDDVIERGIRIIRGGNIQDSKIFLYEDDIYLPQRYYDFEKIVQYNDIVIVASTGSKVVIGKAGFVTGEMETMQIGAFLRIIRPIKEETADYIKILFQTSYYQDYIRSISKGTNINNIKAEYITEFIVAIPPISEQIRIISTLKTIFTQIDGIFAKLM